MYEKLTQMAAVMALLLAALAYLAVRGWRSRSASQSGILPELPHGFATEAEALESEVFYVVTTLANQPLERVMKHGLGNRGKAHAAFGSSGLSLQRVGEKDLFLSTNSIKSIATATATIDKAVERDGLVVITWTNGLADFDTYLRILNRDFRAAVLGAQEILSNTKKVG